MAVDEEKATRESEGEMLCLRFLEARNLSLQPSVRMRVGGQGEGEGKDEGEGEE